MVETIYNRLSSVLVTYGILYALSASDAKADRDLRFGPTYTAGKKDTYKFISKKVGIPADEIRTCNPTIGNKLDGITLRLYDVYVVVKGDYISKIARKYGMSLADFLDYNPSMEDLNNLPIGYKLAIPCREPLKDEKPRRENHKEDDVNGDKPNKKPGIKPGMVKPGRVKVAFPSGLELRIVTNPELVGKGKYFEGSSDSYPLLEVSQRQLFKPVSKHFRLAELLRVEEKDCIGKQDKPHVYEVGGDYYFKYIRLDPRLIVLLEKLRKNYGKSLIIDEGYRPPLYNKCVGGGGPHPKGIAADLGEAGYYFTNKGTPRLTKLGKLANKRFSKGGRGFGSTTTHVDTGKSRGWCYGLNRKQCKRLRK
ncbi:LysM peptidoglycan-binding domain-containing protein [Candidatus Woesearchaeota archaeon]|nr:LysM peptidoglycan-binding domain-containing protein [Candidatus Woesearchaeota archaeon]